MEKTCFKCGQLKPFSDYYPHPNMADGHLGKCKECTRQDARDHRSKNLERIQEYDRNRPNAAERIEQNRAWGRAHPAAMRQVKKGWSEANRTKRQAQAKVTRAIHRGELVRPAECERCGASGRIEGHHPDYSQPLYVLWLCDPCHKAVHKQERAEARTKKEEA